MQTSNELNVILRVRLRNGFEFLLSKKEGVTPNKNEGIKNGELLFATNDTGDVDDDPTSSGSGE